MMSDYRWLAPVLLANHQGLHRPELTGFRIRHDHSSRNIHPICTLHWK